ncbi:hypothetical protein GDO81_017974 [Engystomops pustulosus]|uniref:Uncharacterized protein n=1 Tax=Engystomops pustulosus TaxID=76066 RepID=A0AAV7A6A1_ENGPU|nr:hypothetical protein GDO81_017974 [Engystomops pustulosus]
MSIQCPRSAQWRSTVEALCQQKTDAGSVNICNETRNQTLNFVLKSGS